MPGAEGMTGTVGPVDGSLEGAAGGDGLGHPADGCMPPSIGMGGTWAGCTGSGIMGAGGAYRAFCGNVRIVILMPAVGDGTAALPLLPPDMADVWLCMPFSPGIYAERKPETKSAMAMTTRVRTTNVRQIFKMSCAMPAPNDGIGRAGINVMAYFSGRYMG